MSYTCNSTFKPYNTPDNRCPKQFPVQTCVYTTQGLLMCNAKGNEHPDMKTDIELNIHQPVYHQLIQKQYPNTDPRHFSQST